MNKEVERFVSAVSDERRTLCDKLHELIMSMYPDAEVAIYYGIPTYKVKGRRVGLGYWKGGFRSIPTVASTSRSSEPNTRPSRRAKEP